MKYVLDTNTLSELMRGNPATVAKLKACSSRDVAIPQPVVAEIAFGLALLPKSKRRAVLEHRWRVLRGELRRVAWTDAVSRSFGAIKAALQRRGEPLEDFDVAIAAHAAARGLCLATGNLRHMSRIRGLKLEDWTVVET